MALPQCPQCAGPNLGPAHPAGILSIRHTLTCNIGQAEDTTAAADKERTHLLGRPRFTRRTTPAERVLLTAAGYQPDEGSPWADESPGTLVEVRWATPGIRHRAFPTLVAPEPPPVRPTTPQVRQRRPTAW